MKKALRVSTVLALGAVLLSAIVSTGCAKETDKTLYLYNWTYYTPDSVIEKFEQEYGVKVIYDDYASNEDMYAKLKAGGSGYDIVIPSQDYVSIMKKDMLEKIDISKIPNVKYIKPECLSKIDYDPNMEYSVPYYMGAAGVAVNKEKVAQYEENWNIFARKDLKDRMCMLDDMREVLGDALAYLGYSVNTTNQAELDQATELVNNEWKPNLVKFDAEGFAKSFATGEFWVVQGYAEAVYAEVPPEMQDKVGFFIPKNGPMYLDSMCIPKGAKNIELAHKFINFILRPDIYAEFLDAFGFPSTIHTEAGALQKVTPLYGENAIVDCELKNDLGENLEIYNQAWQKIRFTE